MAATDIIDLAAAKKQLNIPVEETSDDEELAGYVSGVTRVVERYVGVVIGRSVTDVFDGGGAVVLLRTLPVLSITSVTDSGATVDASGYRVSKPSGVLTRVAGPSPLPFLPGFQSVEVTYQAGQAANIAEVKEELGDVRLAALLILQHMWDTQRPAAAGPFSQGSDDFDPRYTYSIPRRALELLGEPLGGIA